MARCGLGWLAAITRRDDAAPALRAFHDALAAVDPLNGGQLIAADAVVPRTALTEAVLRFLDQETGP